MKLLNFLLGFVLHCIGSVVAFVKERIAPFEQKSGFRPFMENFRYQAAQVENRLLRWLRMLQHSPT